MTPEQLAKGGSEHSHQVALFAWANMAAKFGLTAADDNLSYTERDYANQLYWLKVRQWADDRIPELELLFAIHNQGHGDRIRGASAKAEGVKSGVPDLMLPVARPFGDRFNTQIHGLFIELKKPGKYKVSDAQDNWKDALEAQGYKVEICIGWLEARAALLVYLGR